MSLRGRRYGHIRVERILGQGGMGDVYEGFDEKLTRRVALKVLHHEALIDDEAKARLTREARTLSQLDHPNICRIYDFIEDGESDVLVLELIDGRTLDQAMKDGLPHAEKVRIAHDVASVLVAAHRAGILHRDLKPENVMLTESGVVKVLDFGLARWLERRSGRNFRAVTPPAMPPLHVADPNTEQWPAMHSDRTAVLPVPVVVQDRISIYATALGVTVGTPLFMSPEQARGEPLTTASDIYSFGLMLQALFTGAEPYPEGLNAREVMLKAARGNSLPVTGVPHDIAALIKALKALAPSDRLTAADALQRIKHIIDAPKRMIRNAVLATLVVLAILGGWKYATDLQRERTAARQAETEAKKRRADADSLISFMLGDLRTKLEPVGRVDVLDSVAERSLKYMSSLDTKTLTPEELARNSKALYQLGEVRMAQGNLAAAIGVFNQSLSLAQVAQKRAPNDPELALGVGLAHFYVGNALRLRGDDLPAALTQMREYRRITEELALKYPANDEYLHERAYGYSAVGTILELQDDLPGALEEYRSTLALRSSRLAGKPADPNRRADVAVALNKIAFVLERLGQLAAARDYFEREFAIYQSLARDDAKHAHWKDRLANSHDYVAGVLEYMGDASALGRREAAVAAYRDLVAHDPANAEWRRNLAISMQKHANLLRATGNVSQALQEFAESEAVIKKMMALDPARSSLRTDLALIDCGYARALLEHGEIAAAREKASTSVNIYSDVFKKRPAFRPALAEAFLIAGEVAAAAGDRSSAEASWRSAVGVLQPVTASTSDPRLLAVGTRALILLGRDAEAKPLITRTLAIGYRERDFQRLLQRRK